MLHFHEVLCIESFVVSYCIAIALYAAYNSLQTSTGNLVNAGGSTL